MHSRNCILFRIERLDRIVLRTGKWHVIDVPPAQRNGFEEVLCHFREAILGHEENPLDLANANWMMAYIKEIRSVGGVA